MVKKTRRGVFINLEDSDIVLNYEDKTYKFSSYKKRDVYIKRVNKAIGELNKCQGKIYRLTELKEKDFSLLPLISKIYDITYKQMLYK